MENAGGDESAAFEVGTETLHQGLDFGQFRHPGKSRPGLPAFATGSVVAGIPGWSRGIG